MKICPNCNEDSYDEDDGCINCGFGDPDYDEIADDYYENDFPEADDLHTGEVFEGLEAGGAHLRPAQAHAARAGRECLELRDQFGGVRVARGFAGEDEKSFGHWGYL